MNKRKLLDLFIELIQSDLNKLTQSARAAHESAIHTESKAEDQYDTRGLEASYLAGAQSKRIIELDESINVYTHLNIQSFTSQSPIASTALIELKSNEKSFFYLLMPVGGGLKVEFENKIVHLITPQSPLGAALLGKKVGAQIELKIQNEFRDYDIVRVD